MRGSTLYQKFVAGCRLLSVASFEVCWRINFPSDLLVQRIVENWIAFRSDFVFWKQDTVIDKFIFVRCLGSSGAFVIPSFSGRHSRNRRRCGTGLPLAQLFSLIPSTNACLLLLARALGAVSGAVSPSAVI